MFLLSYAWLFKREMIQRDKPGNSGTKSLKAGQSPQLISHFRSIFIFGKYNKSFLFIIKAEILVQFRHTVHLVVMV